MPRASGRGGKGSGGKRSNERRFSSYLDEETRRTAEGEHGSDDGTTDSGIPMPLAMWVRRCTCSAREAVTLSREAEQLAAWAISAKALVLLSSRDGPDAI
jgi:hypothetical protein